MARGKRQRNPCKCLTCEESKPRKDGPGLICELLKEACNGKHDECVSGVCERRRVAK